MLIELAVYAVLLAIVVILFGDETPRRHRRRRTRDGGLTRGRFLR